MSKIPDIPIPKVHSMPYFSCGKHFENGEPHNGHFHITLKGAKDCIAKQKKQEEKFKAGGMIKQNYNFDAEEHF